MGVTNITYFVVNLCMVVSGVLGRDMGPPFSVLYKGIGNSVVSLQGVLVIIMTEGIPGKGGLGSMNESMRALARHLAYRLGELEVQVQEKTGGMGGIGNAGDELRLLRERIAALRSRLETL